MCCTRSRHIIIQHNTGMSALTRFFFSSGRNKNKANWNETHIYIPFTYTYTYTHLHLLTRKKINPLPFAMHFEKVRVYYFLWVLCFICGDFFSVVARMSWGPIFNLMLKSLRAEIENGVNHMTTWLITSLQKNCFTPFVVCVSEWECFFLSRTFKESQGLFHVA